MSNHPPLPPFPARPRPRSGHRIFHEGELEAHQRFGVTDEAQTTSEIVLDRLGMGAMRLLESLPFFFLAAASPDGAPIACDIVHRLRGGGGQTLPLLHVLDAKNIIFPLPPHTALDPVISSGQHWGAGLLFVDFLHRGARYRVNGRAQMLPSGTAFGELWPQPCRLIHFRKH